ncbi:MAG TPA: glycosyltransferase [Pyrinomonadaceae bacterium]|nr:glycosyltransferase [Pyrinomonadaceae bacterium]
MKVLIDGQTLLTAEITRGIGTYFVNTLEQVLHYDFVNDFYLAAPHGPQLNVLSRWARSKLQILANDAYDTHSNQPDHDRRYSDALNNDIERLGIDLYWTPNALMDSVVLPARLSTNCKFAVTIFDLIPTVMEAEYAQQWPAAMLSSYRNKLKHLEKDFDLFLHISHHTQADFLKTLDVAQKQHVVTHLGADPAFRPYQFPHGADTVDYVIYPGGFDPRKNMDQAVASFADLQQRYAHDPKVAATQLCIVCHADRASEARLLGRAKKLGLDGKVFLTGFVDAGKLIELYQKARCLFFPSLYEGFGLPVLEGLACGLPVAASNTSSVPEVGGDHAFYFDPRNVTEMADALYQALQSPMDHESKQKRYEYASSFSWKKTALATLDAFGSAGGSPATDDTSLIDTLQASRLRSEAETDFIDVRQRMKELSVEDLCATADTFYARLDNWDYLHAKPLASASETPELLINFSHVVLGLNLLPDMTIVDFGAGACWTSRFLSQMGMQVIAVDVSAAALKIGEDLYRRHPLIGAQPEPRFLHFDGHKLDLPDESVDRISCWDAFHHVPNPVQVLKEMSRVLKLGGVAGFSEPGPNHSKSPQSQYEMRTNQLIENDVDLNEIWMAAQAAGFTDIKVALFNPKPLLQSLGRFDEYVSGAGAGEDFVEDTRSEMQHRRVFFLFKGDASLPDDSRRREGLRAALQVEPAATRIDADGFAELRVSVTNTGTATWLPGTSRVGAVRFGVHLFDEAGTLLDLDYYRKDFSPDEQLAPGDSAEFVAEVPLPSAGVYVLQCDLVSEGVCWFEHNGSPTVRLRIEVV